MQKNRVGGGGQLGGGDEKELGRDRSTCREQSPAREIFGQTAHVEQEYETGEDAAPRQNGQRLPIERFDEYPAGAP